MQQNLGETARQGEQDNIFDLLARSAQTAAKNRDQSDRNFGIIPDERNEISALDDHQFAVIDCNGICSPLPTIEKSYFAEKLAGNHQVEYRVLSLFCSGADPHSTSAQRIQ